MSDTPKAPPKSNVKETITSVIIAFVLAFVFRGFVVEAFLIPTGSMAPTLLGVNMLLTNPQTGTTWPVGPRDYSSPGHEVPLPFQGEATRGLKTTDPITRRPMPDQYNVPVRAGDRIFVMKYLYSIFDPQRWDVVVFRNPSDARVNYIKRLIGLPGEQLALIDGDVFVRTPKPDDPSTSAPWSLTGWHVVDKPELAQREMWQGVFDSSMTPRQPIDGRAYQGPFKPRGNEAQWEIAGRQDYRYSGQGPTSLAWDAHPIRDYYAYDEIDGGSATAHARFPVGDLSLSAGIKPEAPGTEASLVVLARRHEFRALVQPGKAQLQMRPQPSLIATPDNPAPDVPWTTLLNVDWPGLLPAGEVTNLEFWHVDQTLQLWKEGRLIAKTRYDWTPGQRLQYATSLGKDWEEQLRANPMALSSGEGYQAVSVRFDFSGGPLTLYRVALARDIYYQPSNYADRNLFGERHSRAGQPALATHPNQPLQLHADQFFCCGDNSPASLDGRLWDKPEPWVRELDATPGIVPRDMLIGKAFFVYFPAPSWRGTIPILDFGRMRFIW